MGRYDEASELLESALKTTPNHALAKRTLELLKDPIRTNPALTPQHAWTWKRSMASFAWHSGIMSWDIYDEALKRICSVLLIDPYNTAAARQEQVNRARTSYFPLRGTKPAERPGGGKRPLGTPSFRYGSSRGEPESFSQPLENPVVSVDRKLGMIRLPRVQLGRLRWREAVDYLRNQSQVHDEAAQTEAERGLTFPWTPVLGQRYRQDIAAKIT